MVTTGPVRGEKERARKCRLEVAFGTASLRGIEEHGDHALIELVLEGRNDWEKFG